jgi:ubiquinone/menaquinone biosynthesis C-methylase UbiE
MTKKDSERLLNDQKIAQDWISTIESERGRIRETDIYPKLHAWVNQVMPRTIIEIGCGQGICSNHFDIEGRNYTGIDTSELLITRARELYSDNKRSFKIGNAYAIPFQDDVFDAAFSISVWHLLNDLQEAAKELSRILKSQGHYLIISANPAAYSLWTDLYVDSKLDGKRFEGKMKLKDSSTIHEVLYLHTLDEITKSLEASDLKVLNIEAFRTSDKSKGLAQFVLISGRKI